MTGLQLYVPDIYNNKNRETTAEAEEMFAVGLCGLHLLTLVLVSDAVRQDGHETVSLHFLSEAEVGVSSVRQTQVDWKLSWHP